jgi:hypothetical protein
VSNGRVIQCWISSLAFNTAETIAIPSICHISSHSYQFKLYFINSSAGILSTDSAICRSYFANLSHRRMDTSGAFQICPNFTALAFPPPWVQIPQRLSPSSSDFIRPRPTSAYIQSRTHMQVTKLGRSVAREVRAGERKSVDESKGPRTETRVEERERVGEGALTRQEQPHHIPKF